MPGIINIGGLIFLMIFIYAILGMNLFGFVPIPIESEKQSIQNADFSSFFGALLALFT